MKWKSVRIEARDSQLAASVKNCEKQERADINQDDFRDDFRYGAKQDFLTTLIKTDRMIESLDINHK